MMSLPRTSLARRTRKRVACTVCHKSDCWAEQHKSHWMRRAERMQAAAAEARESGNLDLALLREGEAKGAIEEAELRAI